MWLTDLAGTIKFGLIDVQGVLEQGAPSSADGRATLVMDTGAEELRLLLPRAWTITTPTGETRSFNIAAGTELTNLRAVALDGIGEGSTCLFCTPIDRANGGSTSVGFGETTFSVSAQNGPGIGRDGHDLVFYERRIPPYVCAGADLSGVQAGDTCE